MKAATARLALVAATACPILVMTSTSAGAAMVYNQALGGSGSLWTSHISTTQGGFQTWDNFTLGSDTTIRSVSWQGTYLNGSLQNSAVTNTDFWEIGIYADSSGTPGSLLSTTTIANPSASIVGTGSFGANNPIDLYSFTANLSAPIALSAGVQYWFSPLSRTDSAFIPLFGWSNASTPVDARSYQTDTNGNSFVRSSDRAFQLFDTRASVPEPATWLMMIGGFLIVGATMRRRLRVNFQLA